VACRFFFETDRFHALNSGFDPAILPLWQKIPLILPPNFLLQIISNLPRPIHVKPISIQDT
jgi:hypothetical protein